MYILKRFLGKQYNVFNSIIDNYNMEQNNYINLTACVSYPFQEVLDVQAMPLATVPTEGTRGNRYFPIVNSMDQIEDYAESLALQLFHINDSSYKVSIQPNSGTQANQIVYNAVLKNGDKVLALNPKDGGHISHTKLGCRNITPYYFSLDRNLDVDYDNLEYMINKVKPSLVIVGASSYIKEFNYKKIHSITSKYDIPLLADICHSVLYVMGELYENIFPYVDFATFTMDKLLCGPQGGVLIYKSIYDRSINTSIFPKTQGGPVQCSLFSKTMCFLKLSTFDLHNYSRQVVDNANILINQLRKNGFVTINSKAYNHIILVDLSASKYSGMDAEKILFENGILCNRNQIPNDRRNAMITSGIRLGTVPITNLKYTVYDINQLGNYISSILKNTKYNNDILLELLNKYHKGINISN